MWNELLSPVRKILWEVKSWHSAGIEFRLSHKCSEHWATTYWQPPAPTVLYIYSDCWFFTFLFFLLTILAEVRELFQEIKFLCNKIHAHPCTIAKKDATHASLVFQFPNLHRIGDLHRITCYIDLFTSNARSSSSCFFFISPFQYTQEGHSREHNTGDPYRIYSVPLHNPSHSLTSLPAWKMGDKTLQTFF